MEEKNKLVSDVINTFEAIKEEAILRATTILPPDSTSEDLQKAIDSATSGDTIEISSDMTFTSSVAIPAEKSITIQSTLGNQWALNHTRSVTRHFIVDGTLILQNVLLDGIEKGGGIRINAEGTFNMNINTTIQNCYNSDGAAINAYGVFNMNNGIISKCSANNGGGVYTNIGSLFNMYGGAITNNSAGIGGGVLIYDAFNLYQGDISNNTSTTFAGGVQDRGKFSMFGGTISNNTANNYAGGVLVHGNGLFTMSGGEITKNTVASGNGGGVYALYGDFDMSNGTINENTATNGGGIYASSNRIVNVTGDSYITNNTATVDGGGIYMINNNYANLNTDSTTVFMGNKASAPYAPPENASILYPNIGFKSTSIAKHPLNNFDINYKGELLTFNVSFESNGGTAIASQTVNYEEPATKPTDPTRGGYLFDGWYSDNVTFENKWDFETAVTADIILYAKWIKNELTVIFNSNGGTPVASQTVIAGEPATKPTDPTRESYTFDGWYIDDETFANKWDFETVVIEDITLYAKWNINQYTVCFECNGGTPIDTQTVIHGQLATKPTDPTREGYAFDDWYSDDETSVNKRDFATAITNQISLNKWDFETPITNDITLYAEWNINQYTVCFECNGGTPIDTQTVNYGQLATRPTDPSREGCTFDDWYIDDETFVNKRSFATAVTDQISLNKWNFETPITKDITLYAEWNSNQYTVCFECNGGTPIDSQTVSYGELATRPTNPSREGYTFDDWYIDDETFVNMRNFATPVTNQISLNKWDFATPITKDITLYAEWNSNQYTVCFECNGGTPIDSQTVNYGELATRPTDPSREGYTFDDWYINDEIFVNKWDFATPITNDITLYANWVEDNIYRRVLLIILILSLINYMECKYECRCRNRYRCRNYYYYLLVINSILPLI